MFATVHTTLIYGVIFIIVGIVHLTFRRYYARRATVMQHAHREAAPGPTRRLHWVGSDSTNLTLGTISGAAIIALGLALTIAGVL